ELLLSSLDYYFFFFFFFQAEDGIRDRNVTGVQTCALPISHAVARDAAGGVGGPETDRREWLSHANLKAWLSPSSTPPPARLPLRSEERRVGKECGVVGGSDD